MITASEVSFVHPGSVSPAIHKLSFNVRGGELVCLTGKNGSGKSTLLSLLAGVYSPNSGTLLMAGPDGEKIRVGLVPQDPDIYILGSLVEEDLLLALEPGDHAAHARAMSMAARFGLDGVLGEAVHTLSYGQKKKLSLASALAAAPNLLLLDEPFSGLDYPAALAMRELLAENRAQGLTQIVCEHDLDLMADLADNLLLLNMGELVANGRGNEVFPLLPGNGVRPPCWWFTGATSPLWKNKS